MPERKRWARWVRRVSVLLGVGLALHLSARLLIAWRIERGLAERIHADVEIEKLELDIFTPSVVATDVHTPRDGRVAVTRLDIKRLDLSWSWSRLLRLSPRAHVTVVSPHVELDLDASRSKVGDMKGVTLQRLADLQVDGGTIDVDIVTASGPSHLSVRDIDLSLSSTDWDAGRHADVEVHAAVGETGTLSASGLISTVAVAEDWSLEFDLSDFAVAELNTVWMDLLEMDVERGSLSVKGRLRRSRQRLKGEITPRFTDLLFLGADETARHGIGEALFGHMLSQANSTIEINRTIGTGTGATLQEVFGTDWEALIAGIIQRGYRRRLSTLKGFAAEIGDVEVHFDEGLIVLKKIRLTRDTRRVPVPFLAIERLDVRFDPEVTSLQEDAFKHVVIHRPELTFVKGWDDDRSQLRFDPDWVDKISAMPFKTRDVIVHDGTIAYWDDTAEERVRFAVEDFELVGSEMARGMHPAGHRGATVSAWATAEGVAPTWLVVDYEPGDVANADVSFAMQPLPFEVFEPLLRAKAGVEVKGGKFGVSGRVKAEHHHVEAVLRPIVYGIHLADAHADRPAVALTRKVIERRMRRLGGRTLEISYDYAPDEKAFGTFTQRLIKVAVEQTHRPRFFGRE